MDLGPAWIGLVGVMVGGLITFVTEVLSRHAAERARRADAQHAAEAAVLDWLVGLRTVVQHDLHEHQQAQHGFGADNPYDLPKDLPSKIDEYRLPALRASLDPTLKVDTRTALAALRLDIEQWSALVADEGTDGRESLTTRVERKIDRVVASMSPQATAVLSDDPRTHRSQASRSGQ